MITVTKPYFPPLDEYVGYLEEIWASGQLTNHGPMVQRLEGALAERIRARHVLLVSNGTIALQLALRALGVTQEVITTPFSYVATTTSILWEHCVPVFADVEPATFCIDPKKVEAAITPRTQAILATHVFGNPCDVHALQQIADKHRIKVIYDGAHAFDTRVGEESVLTFGDVTTLSFHATKLFHTVEGGALVVADESLAKQLALLRSFGHIGDEHYVAGTNAKSSELHAAMGLCMLPRVEELVRRRKEICAAYDSRLRQTSLRLPRPASNVRYNYAYYPVLFRTEHEMLCAQTALKDASIGTRRYFYPSLNTLPYLRDLRGPPCPIAEDIAARVLCLPLYPELREADVERIAAIVAEIG